MRRGCVLVALVLLAACSGGGDGGAATPDPTKAPDATSVGGPAPSPVLGRPIDDGSGLVVGYVPPEYGLAGVQGWPVDARVGQPRTRSLFLNGPGGQVDVVVAVDTPFAPPDGSVPATVAGRPAYTTEDPRAVVWDAGDGVVLTVASPGLPLEELVRMAEAVTYDPSADRLPDGG